MQLYSSTSTSFGSKSHCPCLIASNTDSGTTNSFLDQSLRIVAFLPLKPSVNKLFCAVGSLLNCKSLAIQRRQSTKTNLIHRSCSGLKFRKTEARLASHLLESNMRLLVAMSTIFSANAVFFQNPFQFDFCDFEVRF